MKVGDLIRVNTEGDGILVTPSTLRHGQLGVIIELVAAGAMRRPGAWFTHPAGLVMLTDGTKGWFETKRLEVVNESR